MNLDKITQRYFDLFPGDFSGNPVQRQTPNFFFALTDIYGFKKAQLLHFNESLAEEIGLGKIENQEDTDFLNATKLPENVKTFSTAYAGHQFGQWAGQLGDGRAIYAGEIKNSEGKSTEIQWKGAGATPYSRHADGRAVLRSSIREYLCSEAMFHLGIPTTRALSLSLSGDKVLRDIMYDGNPAYEKGAIVCRVAESFLRFGNYEIFAARNDVKNLKILVDYTLRHHFPHLKNSSKETYIQFFKEVAERTLSMIIHWQRVGFVHGVMNTDNMSILGLTIDYGPYGWLEGFDFGWTPNTTDRQHKRYRYGNQPNIGLWNLYQLANALFPLIEEVAPLESILKDYKTNFESQSLQLMKSKLGLFSSDKNDAKLIQNLEDTLQLSETDMTIFFRLLSDFTSEKNGFEMIKEAFYDIENVSETIKSKWQNWFGMYANRLQQESLSAIERKLKMNAVNPKYVLRNYMAQLAIDAANLEDYSLIDELFQLLKKPYDEQTNHQKWFAKRPDWARDKVGCSMLSCSS